LYLAKLQNANQKLRIKNYKLPLQDVYLEYFDVFFVYKKWLNFFYFLGSMTIVRAKIDVSVPRKRRAAVQQHEKALNRFFDAIVQAILRHVNFDVVKCLLVASPGFTKDQFFEYMINYANKAQDGKVLLDNKGKVILVHSSSGFKHSLKEVLQDPALQVKFKNSFTKLKKRVSVGPQAMPLKFQQF
jgi:stalled ribosome rescue protein Dom34